MYARVAELVDALDLGSSTERYRSSSLLSRTTTLKEAVPQSSSRPSLSFRSPPCGTNSAINRSSRRAEGLWKTPRRGLKTMRLSRLLIYIKDAAVKTKRL